MKQVEDIAERILELVTRQVAELEEYPGVFLQEQTRQIQIAAQTLKTLTELTKADGDREYAEKSTEELNNVFS